MAPSVIFASTVALAGVMSISSTQALAVISPSVGMSVGAGTPFEVEWTGGSDDVRFDIDLYYSDSLSFSLKNDCGGFYVSSLCPEGDAGCARHDGGYEVVMPEPIIPGNGYFIRISEVGGGRVRCSSSFYLVDSDAESTGARMTVTQPSKAAVALAGEEYTVEFEYDNGFGSSVGRFKIDLYESEGTGDCGTWVTSICDKSDRGCKDSDGDYNVAIPASTPDGIYKVRVGVFGDDSVYGCSDAFEVLSFGEGLWIVQ